MRRLSVYFLFAIIITAILALNSLPNIANANIEYGWIVSTGTINRALAGTATETPSPTSEPTTGCPLFKSSTPPPLPLIFVEPLTSPTGLFTQVIKISYYLGRPVWVSITSESGKFTIYYPFQGYPLQITIPLLPETTHHLIVKAYFSGYIVDGCKIPAYTAVKNLDRLGKPLVIQQTKKIFQQTVTAISPGYLTPTATRTPWPTATATRTPTRTPIGLRTPQPNTTPEALPRPAFP